MHAGYTWAWPRRGGRAGRTDRGVATPSSSREEDLRRARLPRLHIAGSPEERAASGGAQVGVRRRRTDSPDYFVQTAWSRGHGWRGAGRSPRWVMMPGAGGQRVPRRRRQPAPVGALTAPRRARPSAAISCPCRNRRACGGAGGRCPGARDRHRQGVLDARCSARDDLEVMRGCARRSTRRAVPPGKVLPTPTAVRRAARNATVRIRWRSPGDRAAMTTISTVRRRPLARSGTPS